MTAKVRSRKKPAKDPLTKLREICLAFPEAHEKEAWCAPTFRVRNKLFAMFAEDHHGDGRVAVWCKAAPGAQGMLVEADPEKFFVPPYVGPGGWVGIRLEPGRVDWNAVAQLLFEGYRMTAPKRLLAAIGSPEPPVVRPARPARAPRRPR